MEEDLPVPDLADSFCPSLPLLVPPGARYLQHNDDGVRGSTIHTPLGYSLPQGFQKKNRVFKPEQSGIMVQLYDEHIVDHNGCG